MANLLTFSFWKSYYIVFHCSCLPEYQDLTKDQPDETTRILNMKLCVHVLFPINVYPSFSSLLQECHQPFQNGSFFEHEGMPYCEMHYHARRGSLCYSCQKPITGRQPYSGAKVFFPFYPSRRWFIFVKKTILSVVQKGNKSNFNSGQFRISYILLKCIHASLFQERNFTNKFLTFFLFTYRAMYNCHAPKISSRTFHLRFLFETTQ